MSFHLMKINFADKYRDFFSKEWCFMVSLSPFVKNGEILWI